MIVWMLLETALVVALALAAREGMARAMAGAASQITGTSGGGFEAVAAAAATQLAHGQLLFLLGIGALLLGRWLTFRRGRVGAEGRPIFAHVALPVMVAMIGLGSVLQWGYAPPWRVVDAARAATNGWTCVPGPAECAVLSTGGLSFCNGVVLGGLVGLVVLVAIPERWHRVKREVRAALTVLPVILLALLWLFGRGPGGSPSPRINLWGFQPIELVKASFALATAMWLAPYVEKLQTQRVRWMSFTLPRLQLVGRAAALLVLLFLGLLLVKDLGPTLILSLFFFGMFALCTRAWTELAALGLVLAVLLASVLWGQQSWLPELVQDRVQMWRDPWWNGMSNGDQLARGYWAFAAGALFGQGPGLAMPGVVWAGDNDLVLANLAEVFGFAGIAVYFSLFLLLVGQGFWIARRGRDEHRMLLAFAVCLLMLAQLAVIGSGTLGLLPLTGVVVPFLSLGKTSMVVMMGLVCLTVRLAGEGESRSLPVVRHEQPVSYWQFLLQRSMAGALVVVVLVLLGLVSLAYQRGVIESQQSSARGVLVVQRDGTLRLQADPRVLALARQIPPGEVRDRAGQVLRGVDEDGHRTWPMGSALGTLLGRPLPGGPGDWEIPPERWSIEAKFAQKLRGYPDLPQKLGIWVERWSDPAAADGQARIRVMEAGLELTGTEAERAQVERLARHGGAISYTTRTFPDYSSLVPLIHLDQERRAAALDLIRADVDSRSVRLSLDASLQRRASEALAAIVPGKGKAGAVVVLDVATGEALARAQYPDLNLPEYEGPSWWALRRAADRPESKWTPAEKKFFGAYGPRRERTGDGYLQAGSIFKLVSSLAWARSGGIPYSGDHCGAVGSRTWTCAMVDGAPGFKKSGWKKAIHDAHRTPDGVIEITRALQVSCNAFFAQLGLDLGVKPYEDLVDAGLVLHGGTFKAGLERAVHDAGDYGLAQTAFGQGAAAVSPLEAARIVAAIGAGGVWRSCPSLEVGATCEEARLVEDPTLLTPILAGMKRVVDGGTLKKARLEGVRIFGKTGTAEDVGRREEEPWGVRRGSTSERAHSWVVMFAESGQQVEDVCSVTGAGRLAVAAVVDRGGQGADSAREVALSVLAAAKDLGYFKP